MYQRIPIAIVLLLSSLSLTIGCANLNPRKPASTDSLVPPTPLLELGHPVNWWFAFKLNAATFPGCGDLDASRTCPFGGEVQKYTDFGQQFIYASSEAPALKQGNGCMGDSTHDPVGATFSEIYNGTYYYVIWNDQFYDDPKIEGCDQSCGEPWGHSKGIIAWNEAGEGLVMQVSTPSWPAAGSALSPRKNDGNTLGCVKDDDVMVSQHFFSLRLTQDDVVKVLTALGNSSVVTNPKDKQLVNNGGPASIQQLVSSLGVLPSANGGSDRNYFFTQLSSGVQLISKPSNLNVPPWQMVSAILGGVSLRVASWWSTPNIYSTLAETPISCWSPELGKPGSVQIATSGHWHGQEFGLTGGMGPNFNHAKIGVSTGPDPYVILGDMNQQGTLSGTNCKSSQNGRGGMFFVMKDPLLFSSVSDLISGSSAPTQAPETDFKLAPTEKKTNTRSPH